MRSSTPGKERALSVKTVPRIKKSFAWLYFALPDLLGDVGAGCEAGAAGGAVAGSCCRAGTAPNGMRNTTMQGMPIHCGWRNVFLLASLDGLRKAPGCKGGARR